MPPSLFYGVALAIATLFALVSTYVVWQARETDYASSGRAQLNIASLVADNVGDKFDHVDTLLKSIGRQYVDGLESGAAEKVRFAEHMKKEIADFPFVTRMFVADPSGQVVAGSGAFQIAQSAANIADRTYFKRAAAGDRDLIFEGPVKAKFADEWVIVLSRRLEDGKGAYLGVVGASIPLDFFATALSTLKYVDHGVIVLRAMDGVQIARFSTDPSERGAAGDTNISATLKALLRAPGQDHTLYKAVSPLDHIERLYAFQKFSQAPFFVLAGLPTAILDRSWHRLAVELGLLCLGVTIFALWTARRLHASAARLSEENRLLEKRVAIRTEEIETKNRALVASERKFSDAMANAPIGMALFTAEGRLAEVNAALSDMLGYSREELLALDFSRLAPGQAMDVEMETLRRFAAGDRKTCRIERGYLHKDGRTIQTQVDVSIVRGASGDPGFVVSQVQDVSARVEYEERLKETLNALEQAKAQAEAANTAKSDFLANISHEIRTPLNAILGMAQVLARSPLNADQAGCVKTLDSAGHNMFILLSDVLDLSKIEAGHLELNEIPFSLAEVIGGVAETFAVAANSKGLTLRVEPLPDGLPAMLGDSTRLGQVLINLVGNAIKFTAHGEVTMSVKMLARSAESVRLRIAVRDTGIGIAPENLGKVFEPFVQADGTTYRQFGGTGLGLAITKRLIGLMDGSIGVESEKGKGSEFWFVVSFKASSLRAKAAHASEGHGEKHLSGVRVLIVDDTETNREIAAKLLSLEGAFCETAENGSEAIERLSADPYAFDLVLMDVQMPDIDGLEATRIIRHDLGLADLPVIALTAGTMASQRELALAAGMNGFLSKPFRLKELVAALSPWIRRSDRAA